MNDKPKRTTFRQRMDEMVAALRSDIGMGRYAPGDFLPSEHQLIEQYRLSKNSVRKGLDLLVEQGIVEKVPRVGTRVTSKSESGAVTIKLAYFPSMLQETNLMTLLERFHSAHPGIFVLLVPLPLPFMHLTEQLEQLLVNDPVDVIAVNLPFLERLATIRPLSEQLEQLEQADGVYPFLFRSFQKNGALYAQPFVFSPIVLCYNKEHLRQAGVPDPDSGWTWADLAAAAGKLSANRDRLGFYMHYLSLNRWPLLLLQNRIDFKRDDQGRLTFPRSRFCRSIETGTKLLTSPGKAPMFLSENDTDTEKLFLQQKVSMIAASYFSLNLLRAADFEFDIAPLPRLEDAATLLLSVGLGISKYGKHKHAAKTFIDYCLGADAQLYIRQKTLSIPSVKQAAEWMGEDGLNRPSRYWMYRDIIPTFREYADIGISHDELDRISHELRLYWSGLDPLDTVCDRIERHL